MFKSSEEFSLITPIRNLTGYILAVPCTRKGTVNLTHVHCEKEFGNAVMDTWWFEEQSGKWTVLNILNHTGHVMHQQFNIQQLYVLPTLYLSENKQRLVPLTA